MTDDKLRKLVESHQSGDESLEIIAPDLAREVLALREAARELVSVCETWGLREGLTCGVGQALDAIRARLGEGCDARAPKGEMTKLEALKELKAKVEAGGDVYGFGAIGSPLLRGYAESAFNGSLDAALALHEAVLPEWGYKVKQTVNGQPSAAVAKFPYGVDFVSAQHPARAWLLAILSALIAMETDQ